MKSVFVALALAVGFGSGLLAQSEEITQFTSTVVIDPTGDLIVTEEIAVVAAGDAIKRGIYRDFPTLYRAEMGLKRSVAFEVLEVLRDGAPEQWRTEDRANGVRVYIGNPNHFLSSGPYTYTLKYRTDRQLTLGSEFDELYWNVTGSGWAFPIQRAIARVELPPGASVRSAEGYTGPPGTKGTAWEREASTSSTALLATTAPLMPGEGFTISVTWPKGFLDENANPNDLGTIIFDNPLVTFALLGLAVVFIYYVAAWWFIGRDPPRGVIIPQYEPPKGFTPSAVRFVSKMGTIDNKSFAAAVLQLAVAGVLRISKTTSFKLTRTDAATNLKAGQRRFYEALLGTRKTLELDQVNYQTLQAARKALEKWLTSDFEKAYFIRNSGIWTVGLLLSIAPAAVIVFDTEGGFTAGFMLVWLSMWSLGVIGIVSSAISGFRAGRFWSSLMTALFAVPFVIGWIAGAAVLGYQSSVWAIGVFVVGAALNFIFYHLLKAPTLQGRKVMDHIDGFRHYLSVAERDRLELQNPPERTPELFEKFLPYALALDVEQRWAEQFAEVLAASDYSPTFYSGSDFSRIGTVGLANSLGGAMSSAIASSSTAPGSSSGGGSSGSGGGGSSGGGGGGGGGGGW